MPGFFMREARHEMLKTARNVEDYSLSRVKKVCDILRNARALALVEAITPL